MKFLVPVLLVLIVNSLQGQPARVVVQLKDKENNVYSLSDPAKYLSPRAIQRRLRHRTPIDSLDLPVSKRYLDSISSAGNVKVLTTSRWLNQVLIETADTASLAKIQHFPFVSSTNRIAYRTIETGNDDKFKETVTPAFPGQNRVMEAKDLFNYGNTYGQVHLHEGEFLHNKGFRGETMQVAVLDAGFQQYKTLSAFDSVRLNGQVLGERDLVAFDNSVNEDDAHGMHCLSIMAANWPGKMIGTAPKAAYWLLRTENSASENPIEEYNWVVGAEFADSAGADIISSSLGYNTFDAPAVSHQYNEFYKNTTTISRGAAVAVRKGMIVSVSAGNEGSNNWKYITFPADVDSVCAVGAVNGAGMIAGFSSYGYPGKTKPNIVSLGAGTIFAGANNLPASGNGTSYSNPNVAGLIACLWQAFPQVSNMKILEAVYKSADKYELPNDRYGYGIPNFRKAYQSLKHQENMSLYGNEWIFATPTPFSSNVAVKIIGRIDGAVTLSLVSGSGQVLSSQNLTTEKEEVYNITFSDLSALPGGFYLIKYDDGTTTRLIQIQKGNIFEKDWLVALPNPFTNDIAVYINAQETGEVRVRLIDTRGGVVESITQLVTQNQTTTIRFNNTAQLSTGVYFLQYVGRTQKRTLRLFKG